MKKLKKGNFKLRDKDNRPIGKIIVESCLDIHLIPGTHAYKVFLDWLKIKAVLIGDITEKETTLVYSFSVSCYK